MSKKRKLASRPSKRPTFSRPPKHSSIRAIERALKWNKRHGR